MPDQMEKVAVLLSVYQNDRLAFVKMAVGSVLNQTLQSLLLYIGVDGPVDEDMRCYLEGLSGNEKVTVKWFGNNRGLACVLNDLIDECRKQGIEYYARMDADDVALPDRLQKQLTFLIDNKHVDVVGGAIEEIDENGEKSGKTVYYPQTNELCQRFFRYRDPVAHPAVLFRARYFEKVKNGYRSEYRRNQDTMLWFDGIRNGCVFSNLPDIVLQYRVTENYYKDRLGDWALAKKKLKDRMIINRELHFGLSAYLFAMALFCITIFPAWFRKFLHKRR